MAKSLKTSSLLAKYSLMYEKKPRSRVFAPLAETYRKLGMLDEASKILKDGIRNHPSYTLGYVVLGSCYYDLQNYEMSYNTVRPFVAQNLENITLQKLFAKTCINLGHLDEALQTFKYLMLLNPKDQYVADQIKLLEDDLLISSIDHSDQSEEYRENEFTEDEWVQVNFSKEEKPSEEDSLDEWKVSPASPLDQFKKEVESSEINLPERDLDDSYFHEEFDVKSNEVISGNNDEESADELPIITHTLVDLYCSQGHTDRAIVILENILELHPDDKASAQKLAELMTGTAVEKPVNLDQKKIETLTKIFNLYQQKLNKRSDKVTT